MRFPQRTTVIAPRLMCARRVQGDTERLLADSSIESNSKLVMLFACTSNNNCAKFCARITSYMKYLARIDLRERLAHLPESVSLLSERGVISGLFGVELCDLSHLRREPFHQKFANWRSEPDGIMEFTRRYGPLDWEGGFADLNVVSGLRFAFLTDLWRERQTQFRKLWETARTEGPEGLTWLTLPVAGDFPVATEADRYTRQANYEAGVDEGSLIWQTPETLWRPTRKGPLAQVEAKTTWQYLCLLLSFEKLESLSKCENSECAAPYFIAQRKDQMFCGEDCAHRIAARRWWSQHGNEWRRTRRAQRKRADDSAHGL